MLAAHTRIIDVKPQNRIKSIEKLADGDLAVEFHSGERGVISKDDPEIQAFAVYSVLAEL
ncbi:hypothetical protein [Achromobacter denitrificans]|uniref:hypothetical protein n=1 Tax=Achromobacter denitrificans TaxID=32002 RepID=UPI003B9B7427